MAAIESGMRLGQALIRALGIQGNVKRIVIVADVEEVATVYIQRYLTTDETEPVADAVRAADTADPVRVVEVRSVDVDGEGFVLAIQGAKPCLARVSDQDLSNRGAAILRPGLTTPLPAWWANAVADSNAAAWQDIQSVMLARGYTPAQIAAWPSFRPYVMDQGLFWLSVRARLDVGETVGGFGILKELDRREWLLTAFLTDADGNPVVPATASPIGHGDQKVGARETFRDRNLPTDPYGPGRGQQWRPW